jgi:hypothetical protein
MDNILEKWFTAMHSEGKPATGPMITDEVKSYNECPSDQ